jgi:hypothetical protein
MEPAAVFKVEKGCPVPKGMGCGCFGACHELIEVVNASDYYRLLGRFEQLEASIQATKDAEALARRLPDHAERGTGGPDHA